eukprot:TRINITY_DN290_c1_g1_i2.p1 TRINITY_DN290_c1_g1~~TRINITY_DN290_c1_g1_i2.p1  ORF type:complete len:344 (-),score=92.79 TRINITY_DN290_c1_g1_i2:143-1174(-)
MHGVQFNEFLEPLSIDIHHQRRELKCSICSDDKNGVAMQCHHPRCDKTCHVRCAQMNGWNLAQREVEPHFILLCPTHANIDPESLKLNSDGLPLVSSTVKKNIHDKRMRMLDYEAIDDDDNDDDSDAHLNDESNVAYNRQLTPSTPNQATSFLKANAKLKGNMPLIGALMKYQKQLGSQDSCESGYEEAHRTRKRKRKRSRDFEVHEGIICGGCNDGPIIGVRYRCQDCEDVLPEGYNLCNKCYLEWCEAYERKNRRRKKEKVKEFSSGNTMHAQHSFEYIEEAYSDGEMDDELLDLSDDEMSDNDMSEDEISRRYANHANEKNHLDFNFDDVSSQVDDLGYF